MLASIRIRYTQITTIFRPVLNHGDTKAQRIYLKDSVERSLSLKPESNPRKVNNA